MTHYTYIFLGVFFGNAVVTFRSSELWKRYVLKQQNNMKDDDMNKDSAQRKNWIVLIKKYLFVYLTATLSDWLQGPYVYALYSDYKYTQHEIAVLFVAGFGSSMVFGSFVGGMADWGGRRTFVILFSIIYAASCITKRTFRLYMLLLVLFFC